MRCRTLILVVMLAGPALASKQADAMQTVAAAIAYAALCPQFRPDFFTIAKFVVAYDLATPDLRREIQTRFQSLERQDRDVTCQEGWETFGPGGWLVAGLLHLK